MSLLGHPRRLGTATRLSGLVALALAVIFGAGAFASYRSFSTYSRNQAASELSASIQNFTTSAQSRSDQNLETWTPSYLAQIALPRGQSLVVTLPSSARFATSSAARWLQDPAIRPYLRTRTRVLATTAQPSPALIVAVPLTTGTTPGGSLVAIADLTPGQAAARRVLVLNLLEALFALTAATAATFLVARRLLTTVGRITVTARSIQDGDLEQRLGDPGTRDEVALLAATFDAMLDRLHGAMVSQRRLLADVSHQLKTPLTVLRGHLEVLARTGHGDPAALSDAVAVAVAEIEHMNQLTSQLLLLGRALEPDFTDLAPVDLRAFLAELFAAASLLGPRDFVISPIPDVIVHLDENKIRGAMLNLADNAVKATVRGDTIRISARLTPTYLVLSVEDAGPGIPADQRALVLERFGRPDTERRAGTGLGVSIVSAVARAHGGRLRLEDSPLGGLAAEIDLPLGLVEHPTPPEELP